MPNNFKIVDEYTSSMIVKGKESYSECSSGYAYALGALESKAMMILSHLEIYHPDAYNSVVGMFDVQEETNQ